MDRRRRDFSSAAEVRRSLIEQRHPKAAPARPGRRLKVAGLFAGIGGIELGLHRAGHSTALLCEIDPAAQAVLQERFPGVPLFDDIRTLPRLQPDVDLLAAGFPCQDLSQAGKARGIKGRQSGLVTHVFELLRRRAVPWVLLENVPFMLQLEGGRAMEYVVGQLEHLGYRWAYRVIDSRAFAVPQRRERVYLVASKSEDPRRVLFSGNADPLQDERVLNGAACGFYWTEGTKGLGWAVDAVPTLKGGSTVGIPSPPAILLPSGRLVKPDIRDAERLQGFRSDWTRPAERVARAGTRWKLVGNAVTVPVAEWIGQRFLDLSGNTDVDGVPLRRGQPWPRAAWYDGSQRFAAVWSTWPVKRKATPLAEFMKYPKIPLSVKATAGFLSRARASSLRFPKGFLDAIAAHLRHMKTLVA
jgi:DNA (cytosine-5)-methyltransferase 1